MVAEQGFWLAFGKSLYIVCLQKHSMILFEYTVLHNFLYLIPSQFVLYHTLISILTYAAAASVEYPAIAISSSVNPFSRRQFFHFLRSSLVALGSKGLKVENFDPGCTPKYAKPVSEFLFMIQCVMYDEQAQASSLIPSPLPLSCR